MVETSAQLTADEEKLYDRQIRLWGIESQKRLRSARLLLIGLGGLGAEVAKNIVLSGIKSVTFLDDKPSTKDLAFSQFLIPPDKIGENRAEASTERAKNLNPHVEVTSETFHLADLNEEYFSNSRWDVVVATGLDQDQLERLDNFCRKGNLKFFAGEVFGMFGYFFVDLNKHSYTKTVKTIPKKGVVREDTIKETREFPTFSSAINQVFEKNSSKLRLLDPSYFVLKILLKFRAEKKRNPTDSDEDWDQLVLLRDQELDKHHHPRDKVSDDFLQAVVGAEVSPVCAIVGAVLSQEVIKAVSHKDEPHNNMFFFNPLNNKGTVEQLGKLQS
uniref:SUMO-activating enzyme subunit 1 n=1 Tax=Lygus hesperus TaxID=30085 RepID=A0A146LWM2_LYGHE